MGCHIVKICSNAQKRKTSISYTGIHIILLSVSTVLGQGNFYPVNSCTDITLAEIPIQVYQKCLENDKVIHCLPNNDDVLGLSCFSIIWIEKGRCPYYNNYQGNLDEKACTGDAKLCPPKLFKSPLSVLYKGCYIKEITTTKATPTITTTSQSISTENRTSTHTTHVPRMICNETMSEKISSSGSCAAQTGFLIVFGITTVIFLGLFVAVCKGFVTPCRDKGTSKEELHVSVEKGEGEALLSTETKCQKENEQNNQQHKGTYRGVNGEIPKNESMNENVTADGEENGKIHEMQLLNENATADVGENGKIHEMQPLNDNATADGGENGPTKDMHP